MEPAAHEWLHAEDFFLCTLQAMAAYRTASRLFPGLHQPLLGMGCEYARMNNTALAEQVLRSAHVVCPQVRPPHGPCNSRACAWQ